MGYKTKAVVIILLTLSVLFFAANSIFPHYISTQRSIISNQQVIVVSNETFLNHQQDLLIANQSYYALLVATVGFGRLVVEWSSPTFGYAVFIFTSQQFDHFRELFQSISHSNVIMSSASEWANKGGFTYEAAGYGGGMLGKPLATYCNVTQAGNYYVVITDGLYGGAVSHYSKDKVYFLNEWFDAYSYQTQNVTSQAVVQEKDNLYLYIGTVFLVLAIVILILLSRGQRKTANLNK